MWGELGGAGPRGLPGTRRLPCGPSRNALPLRSHIQSQAKVEALAACFDNPLCSPGRSASVGLLWNDIPIWSTLGSGISSALDILVMVLYFLLVLGIGLWVHRGPEGRAEPWTPGWFYPLRASHRVPPALPAPPWYPLIPVLAYAEPSSETSPPSTYPRINKCRSSVMEPSVTNPTFPHHPSNKQAGPDPPVPTPWNLRVFGKRSLL